MKNIRRYGFLSLFIIISIIGIIFLINFKFYIDDKIDKSQLNICAYVFALLLIYIFFFRFLMIVVNNEKIKIYNPFNPWIGVCILKVDQIQNITYQVTPGRAANINLSISFIEGEKRFRSKTWPCIFIKTEIRKMKKELDGIVNIIIL